MSLYTDEQNVDLCIKFIHIAKRKDGFLTNHVTANRNANLSESSFGLSSSGAL